MLQRTREQAAAERATRSAADGSDAAPDAEAATGLSRIEERKRAALPRPKAGFEPEQAMQSILRLGVRIAKADGPRQPPPTCAQRVAQCLAPPEVPGAAKASKARKAAEAETLAQENAAMKHKLETTAPRTDDQL